MKLLQTIPHSLFNLIGCDHSLTIWLWGHIYIYFPLQSHTNTHTQTATPTPSEHERKIFCILFSIWLWKRKKVFRQWKLVEIQRKRFEHEWKTWNQKITMIFSFNFNWTYIDFDNFPFSEQNFKFESTKSFEFLSFFCFFFTNTFEIVFSLFAQKQFLLHVFLLLFFGVSIDINWWYFSQVRDFSFRPKRNRKSVFTIPLCI